MQYQETLGCFFCILFIYFQSWNVLFLFTKTKMIWFLERKALEKVSLSMKTAWMRKSFWRESILEIICVRFVLAPLHHSPFSFSPIVPPPNINLAFFSLVNSLYQSPSSTPTYLEFTTLKIPTLTLFTLTPFTFSP